MSVRRPCHAFEFEAVPDTEDTHGNSALSAWRRGAVDVFTATLVVIHLPGFILWIAGQGPPRTWPTLALIVPTYLVAIAAAVLRRVDFTIRVWTILVPAYLTATLGPLVAPPGPFLRILPVVLPIIALVLVGIRSGRVATLLSIPAILIVPLVQAIPGLARILNLAPPASPATFRLLLTQGAALMAILLGQMLMLERFHLFLIRALASQRKATADAEREAAQRVKAHRDLAREMAERRRLEQEIARAAEGERRRLGRDIHDGVCQELTGALLHCQVLRRRLEKDESLQSEDLNALCSIIETAIDDAHAVAKGLCPLESDPEALARALHTLVKRTEAASSIRCEFVVAGDVAVSDPAKAQELYRIAQEALSNAARHSGASHILLTLSGQHNQLILQVRDDGIGLPAEVPEGRMGLRTMTYRTRALDGELVMGPADGGGTLLTCRAPRDSPQHDDTPARLIDEKDKNGY